MFERFAGQRVMLLQGPVGPFFRCLARGLRESGVEVTKINLNAADAWYFSGAQALDFRGTFEEWASYLRATLKSCRVDAIFMFGDSRPYHVAARDVASELGLAVYFFEEGYLRPDYVTFEPGGTNFQSRIPKSPDFFLKQSPAEPNVPRHVGHTFWFVAWYASVYAVILNCFAWRYPHYTHHRDWQAFRQACIWWLSAGRKVRHRFQETGLMRRISARKGHYFFVPLQVHDDYQVKNSRFDDVRDFIKEVLESFAKHAAADAFLVFKHHPRDRGYRDYRRFLVEAAAEYSLSARVYYVHDLHLPTLLKGARGSVVINSTVGLSSLFHGTPVKCLDDCVYGACTSAQDLGDFWQEPEPVNKELVSRFIGWLKQNVLLNGSFYRVAFWRSGFAVANQTSAALSGRDAEANAAWSLAASKSR